MEILEPKSIEAFDKKAKKIEKHLAVLDSKQTGETGESIYYNFSWHIKVTLRIRFKFASFS